MLAKRLCRPATTIRKSTCPKAAAGSEARTASVTASTISFVKYNDASGRIPCNAITPAEPITHPGPACQTNRTAPVQADDITRFFVESLE